MKKHWIAAIALVFASFAGVMAAEQWVPGTPLGAKVEFVGLDFSPRILVLTNRMADSRMEVGLVGVDSIFTMDYWSFEDASQVPHLYHSLLDARRTGAGVNLLIDTDTRAILALRIGETEQPLALGGYRARAGWEHGDASKVRFDILGRKAAVTSKPAAGMRIPERAGPAR